MLRPAVLVLLLLGTLVASPSSAGPSPGLNCERGELTLGRVFPEPEHTNDFISFDEARCGLALLDERHPDLLEVKEIAESVGWNNLLSQSRDRFPVLAVELTDESVAEKRGAVVFITSIHGNEKGAREGILRAVEDILIADGVGPRIEGTTGRPVADVLRELRLVFVFPNPDGWTHEELPYRHNDACYVSATCGAASDPGEIGVETQWYVRVNGNGTDLNRQYPTTGALFDGPPPMTEPEILGVVSYLKALPEPVLAGVDLHGMLNTPELNYLLLKDTQRTLLEVLQDEAVAKYAADEIVADETLAPWDATGGPRVVWGATIDLLGYSAPGTGGAYVVQDTGLDAAGYTVEMAYSHITFDNHYQGPGQAMNILHVASIRDIVVGFVTYGARAPAGARVAGESVVGYLPHPGAVPGGRYDGSDADPNAIFAEIRNAGGDVRGLSALTPAGLGGLTHFVLADHDRETLLRLQSADAPGASLADPIGAILRPWVEAGGVLVLTDRSTAVAVDLGVAESEETVPDFSGRAHRTSGHALVAGTNPPVATFVDGNPLGFEAGTVPVHCLSGFTGDAVAVRALSQARLPVMAEDAPTCVVVGEAPLGQGTVRILGAMLPSPHPGSPYGVDGYAVTPNGARVLLNALDLALSEGVPEAGRSEEGAAAGDETGVPGVPMVALVLGALVVACLRRRT
ncbi:MAG: M14 family zinc carboxypeptidase [Methanobacteriota archaeon]